MENPSTVAMNIAILNDEEFLKIAMIESLSGNCLRRCYGAAIGKDGIFISSAHNEAPTGCEQCNEIGRCLREEMNIPSGQRYELCRSVHAEQKSIIMASSEDLIGATLYLVGRLSGDSEILPVSECCSICRRMIISSGITEVKSYRNGEIYTEYVSDWVKADLEHTKNMKN